MVIIFICTYLILRLKNHVLWEKNCSLKCVLIEFAVIKFDYYMLKLNLSGMV